MNEYEEMLQSADKWYHYSLSEKMKIISLLKQCNANDVRRTHRRMFEVFFRCSDMPGMEITIGECNDQCARYSCPACRAADDAECLINREQSNCIADEIKQVADKQNESTLNEIKWELNKIRKDIENLIRFMEGKDER